MISAEEVKELSSRCVKCGLCLASCPVYQEILTEEASPRGRVQLAKHIFHGQEEKSSGVSEKLAEAFYLCTSCNACSVSCPSQIKPTEVIQEGREEIFAAGGAPEPVKAVKENILNTANVYAAKKEDRTAVYPAALRERIGAKGPRKADTVLFLGCVASYLDMKIVPSFIKIMDAAKVDYTLFAEEELCCGLPLYVMGDKENFRKNAKEVIDMIKKTGAREIVTPCAGCYKTFRKYYPEVGDMGVQIYHSVHYILKLIEMKALDFDLKTNKKVTYHDPCDLGRTFEIFDEPREVLKAVLEHEPLELERSRLLARCCGGGGSVTAVGPELAAEMAKTRIKDAEEVGAEVIVSGCSTCKDNLRKGLKLIPKAERPKIRVKDITEIVAEAIT
ncbi:MAG: (Fe-S)-binding protein [Deltaproteobacteria bacterium]|nr:(Fe-S)-binding protein [Deltaproteobacteria bacterium]MBW2299848.1 (Fe-S)-binding protein [Deltaproteobacteria bacterium]